MTDSLSTSMLATIKPIFDATQAVVDSMTNGTRKQIKDIADIVSISLGTEVKKILAFVNHYLHNIEEAGIGYVTRGKNGGFVKGSRPVKVVKTTPVVTATVNTTALDSIIDELDSEESLDSNESDEVESIAV